MAAFLEDQANEVEALQAIFQDDFVPEGSGAPLTAYRLRLVPDMGADAKTNHVAASLCVRYPLTYPEAAPTLALSADRGLSEAQVSELRGVLAASAAENAGTPLVYVVAERVREWLQEHNEPAGEGSAYEEMLKRQRAKERGDAGGSSSGGGGGAGKAPQAAFSKEADPSIKHKPVAAETHEEVEARK